MTAFRLLGLLSLLLFYYHGSVVVNMAGNTEQDVSNASVSTPRHVKMWLVITC